MKKITVTEENFSRILNKMQRVCNKYKMLEFNRVFSEGKETFRSKICIKYEKKGFMNEYGEYECKRVIEVSPSNNFIKVTKHYRREDYENNKDTYGAYLYYKPLIHLDICANMALVISSGDKVQFLPFFGFIVWTDNDDERFGSPLITYKHIFIPDLINGKIKDLNREIFTRENKWEKERRCQKKEYVEYYNEVHCKTMEYDEDDDEEFL